MDRPENQDQNSGHFIHHQNPHAHPHSSSHPQLQSHTFTHPHPLTTDIPLFNPGHYLSRTTNNTPMPSPGPFSPSQHRQHMSQPSQSATDVPATATALHSPYLHPLQSQSHKVRETHKALVDLDLMTGRKLINQYEVIEEIGRGVHGKVKLARNLESGENVAIKIVPRFSKTRRLGKLTAKSPQDKSRKEIAILKKIRHPNVVALLEIIDDPELKKIYMVLEHVERGEIVWRKKGVPSICACERKRVEKEMRQGHMTDEDEVYMKTTDRRLMNSEHKRVHQTEKRQWSLEQGGVAAAAGAGAGAGAGMTREDDLASSLPHSSLRDFGGDGYCRPLSSLGSQPESRALSRNLSVRSSSRAITPCSSEPDLLSLDAEMLAEHDPPVPIRSHPGSSMALDTVTYGTYADQRALRARSPSVADSMMSQISSLDFNNPPHDPYADDFSYVPCFTIEDARATFRDTVLGLEYLHYEGIVHRDIKPANLLWTRDHRVKISDFGVSYFGRPIRDGDQDDDLISESEAQDFDDDLELAKTVGTPAFFAPELCYSELESDQPKISEQVDIWSLGVALYCLVFARIPFMAEDEYQMFRKIAKEEVYIPQHRLKPADPQSSPETTSLEDASDASGIAPSYRNDKELIYEEVDSGLQDLLRRMLTKNPAERIKLRDVKRHPWVLQNMDNCISWIDDTDPSRTTAGRKIEVNDREVSHAVVPLTFLERARSAVKKTWGKVIPHRSDKSEGHSSRRRATSSANSSAADVASALHLYTPQSHDDRRRSLRGDDPLSKESSDHPLTQSITASPMDSPMDDEIVSNYQDSTLAGGDHDGHVTGSCLDFNAHPDPDRPPSRASASSSKAFFQRHPRSRSIANTFLSLAPVLSGERSSAVHLSSPPANHNNNNSHHHSNNSNASNGSDDSHDPVEVLKKSKDQDVSRCRSVDRGLFTSFNKHADPKVSVSVANAPGNVELPRPPPSARLEPEPIPSSDIFSPQAIPAYRGSRGKPDPHLLERHVTGHDPDQRPLTAHRVMQLESMTPPPRVYKSSTPESFARAQAQMVRRQQREDEDNAKRMELASLRFHADLAHAPCPVSPDDQLEESCSPLSRCNTTGTGTTSNLINPTTPMTSPSEAASPVSMTNLTGKKDFLPAFRSDPSLPALLSGASSVSADPEGEFLLRPGCVGPFANRPVLLESADCVTPPALAKETTTGFPLDNIDDQVAGHVHPISLFPQRSRTPQTVSSRTVEEIDDDDSDSDGGLVMAQPKRRPVTRDSATQPAQRPDFTRRRNTQTSIGSTGTAKKIFEL